MNYILLTDIPPCTNYTAGLVIDRLCRFLLKDGHHISCFCIMDKSLTPVIDDYIDENVEIQYVKKPIEYWGARKFGSIYSLVFNNLTSLFVLPKIRKRFLEFSKNKNTDLIWSVVQGQSMIKFVRKAAKEANIPYVVEVWDPPQWWLKENGFDAFTKKLVMNEFGKLLHNSQCCLAASWSMAEEYSKLYSAKCIPVIPSLDKNIELKTIKIKNENEYVIGFAGQMYAQEEWNQFLKALNKMNWKFQGKKIKIILYGRYFNLNFNEEANLEYRGWVDQQKCLEELSSVDLLYCPYWFSKEFEVVSRLSFPSKLTSYLRAKVPVFIHAPEYASTSEFIKKYDAGFICNSMDVDVICRDIENALRSEKNEIIENGYSAFLNNLTYEKMKNSFYNALGLSIDGEIDLSEKVIEKKAYRVLHVNSTDLVGRRFNGHDLQIYLNENGVLSKQLVLKKEGKNKNTVEIFKNEGDFKKYLQACDLEEELSLRSILIDNSRFIFENDEYKNADIVHMHLIHNRVLSLKTFAEIARQKKVVWTIHDPWAFTGHCIYPIKCNRWLSGCGNCPNLNRNFSIEEDTTALQWLYKKMIYKGIDIDIVVASQFMYDFVKRSPLTKHFKHVHLIPFGIDIALFNKDSALARNNLQIDENRIVIFFRSDPQEYKGTELIIEALKKLNTQKQITILTVGKKGMLDNLKDKYEILDKGWVNNPEYMTILYGAADIFLMPSKAEAFGLMAIEAMASKTSIIVCNGTSLPDVTFSPTCGISVEYGDIEALTMNIKMLVENDNERIRRAEIGRELAEKYYDINLYHKKLMKLYDEVYNRD